MAKGARLAIGLTTAGVLLFTSLVSVIVGAVLAPDDESFFDDPYLEDMYYGYDFSGRADSEVLDVDTDGPWTWVDVRFDTGDEVVVTGMEWSSDADPVVGDVVAVAFDPADPEYGVVPEADLDDVTDESGGSAPMSTDSGGPLETGAVVAFWVAGVSGLLALVAVVLTVVWAARAPAPAPAVGWSLPPASPQATQPYRPPGPGPTGWGSPSG